MIDCNFCLLMISNPDCWPKTAIAVIILISYLVLAISCGILCFCRRRSQRCCSHIPQYLNCSDSCLSSQSPDTIPLVTLSAYKTRFRQSIFVNIIPVLSLVMLLSPSQPCQQIFTIDSENIQCSQYEANCFSIHNRIMKINPMSREACLSFQYNGSVIKQIKISLNSVTLQCEAETIFYTRNVRTKIEARKRCAHMGSCIGRKCAEVKPNSLVEELPESNAFSGITYSRNLADFGTLGNHSRTCGYPSSGCLFYRIFKQPLITIHLKFYNALIGRNM